MNEQLAQIALPLVLLVAMAIFFSKLTLDAIRTNPQKHIEVKRRAGSAKNIVLGRVEPKDGMVGGMVVRYESDDEIVVIPTGQLSDEDIS